MASAAVDFRLSLDDITFGEGGLYRPECILATARGALYVSDIRGAITEISATGARRFVGRPEPPGERRFKPNGFAMRRDGSFLFANQGAEGGVFALSPDGEAEPYLVELDGWTLPPANFVLLDGDDRVWISLSTRRRERHSFRADSADGIIILVDGRGGRGARIVGDGFVWTNEFRIDAAGEWLYVCETMGKRLTRLRLGADGLLGARERVASFGPGDFPDGLALDADGGMWITSPVSNRIWRVTPEGEKHLVFEDGDEAHIAEVERLLAAGELTGPKVHEVHGTTMRNVTSLAFGGPNLRTAYLGFIAGDAIASFPSPVAGQPMVHWHW